MDKTKGKTWINILRDFNIPLSVTIRINIHFEEWIKNMNNMIKNFELADVYRTLYRIHNLFKYWGNIKRKWLCAALKTSLNKFQKLQYTDVL